MCFACRVCQLKEDAGEVSVSAPFEPSQTWPGIEMVIRGASFFALRFKNPRLGVLTMPSRSVQRNTPTVFVKTSRLGVPHLTPDNLLLTTKPEEIGGLEMYADQLHEKTAWSKCPLSLSGYAGVPEYSAVLATRDAECCGRKGLANTTDTAILVQNACGIQKLDIATFVQMAQRLKPDLVICPSDRFGLPVNEKRFRKAQGRTLQYAHAIRMGLAEEPCRIFASIPGQVDEQFVVGLGEFDGYAITGLHGMPEDCLSLPSFVDTGAIKTITRVLPEGKPVYYRGMCSPIDVFNLYHDARIDIFDTTYPMALAEKGCALLLTSQPASTESLGTCFKVINLWEQEWETCTESLQPDCDCACCGQPYMRAYLHHLLHTKEMLAQVLLTSHNLRQFMLFVNGLSSIIQGHE